MKSKNPKKKLKFYRIYWTKRYNWMDRYAKEYDKYCKSKNNYYVLSAKELLKVANVKPKQRIIDLGCGVGILSKFLSKLHCTITAIDISPEMLYYFKKNLASKIKKDKIKTIEGNAEEIHKFVRSVDKIIVACAFWDMYTKSLLRNVSKIMDKKSELIFNLPALTIDEEKGVIYFFENSFRQEFPKANLYRRIDLTDLQNELNKNGLKFRKIIPYSFYLQKNSIQYFFKVLRVRYPFIFLPDIPYNKAVKICDKIFTKALDKTSKRGIKEEGKIFVIGKK